MSVAVSEWRRGTSQPKVEVAEGDFVYDDTNISTRAALDFLAAVVTENVVAVVEKVRKNEAGLLLAANTAAGWLNGLEIAEVTPDELIAVVREVSAFGSDRT